MRHLINLFILYKSSIEHNIELLVIPCADIKKQPTANIIDGNVQLHILSLIPDNFQGVTEIVSDGLPKPSRVNIVTKENL